MTCARLVGFGGYAMNRLALFAHDRVCFGRSVVLGSEPFVERDVGAAVVALKIAMVQLVEVVAGAYADFTWEGQLFEPDVALGWGECGVLRVHQHVDRVGRQDPVEEDAAEVDDVFDGVHGQA